MEVMELMAVLKPRLRMFSRSMIFLRFSRMFTGSYSSGSISARRPSMRSIRLLAKKV